MADRIDVMISSTARDLPEHRQHAMDACLRMGMFPIMMEHLPANDDEAISASLKMVDDAEIYVGVYAWRYGYVPKGHDISVTEMEYNRAKERGIPRLVYLMHEDHPTTGGAIEKGEGAVKLEAFKTRVKGENIINEFKSPEDLRGLVIHGLSKHRTPNLTNLYETRSGDIPAAPEPYIAHPYTLLQTAQVIGRQAELNLLTDWVTKPTSDVYKARILNIVAIGGMGKSALTWKWFNEIAPLEMKPLKGRLWWSFYESDAHFGNFLPRALAYVSGLSREQAEQLPPGEQETRLLHILDHEPYLLVLDGLERILMAYARADAAYLADDKLDEDTANRVAGALGLPESARQAFIGQHRLRKTADPRVGNFLRKLAGVKAARILVSTRLYPADLQTVTGAPMPGSFASFITGLQDDDALALWRAMGVSGSRDTLLPMFRRFENYPLLIRALAGVVAAYKRAPGDFDKWKAAHPDFNPFKLELVNVKSHVLEHALRGLDDKAKQVLWTVAAFRMPAGYDTLTTLHVGQDRLFGSEMDFDMVLTNLEDRGLLGWDKGINRYDLHPIVRGMVWGSLNVMDKRSVYESLKHHFESVPPLVPGSVHKLEMLAPVIELYNSLIGLGRYDDAYVIFRERLDEVTFDYLGMMAYQTEWLEMLFADGLDKLPRLSTTTSQASALNDLALSYKLTGDPAKSIPIFKAKNFIDEEQGAVKYVSVGLSNLADACHACGKLFKADLFARSALNMARQYSYQVWEAYSLLWLGINYGARSMSGVSGIVLVRALNIYATLRKRLKFEGIPYTLLAQIAVWSGNYNSALEKSETALKLTTSAST